jgi:hypothetical protein
MCVNFVGWSVVGSTRVAADLRSPTSRRLRIPPSAQAEALPPTGGTRRDCNFAQAIFQAKLLTQVRCGAAFRSALAGSPARAAGGGWLRRRAGPRCATCGPTGRLPPPAGPLTAMRGDAGVHGGAAARRARPLRPWAARSLDVRAARGARAATPRPAPRAPLLRSSWARVYISGHSVVSGFAAARSQSPHSPPELNARAPPTATQARPP